MKIGLTIKKLRRWNGWSQNFLANKLGVSKELMHEYESSNMSISIQMANKLADIFGVSLDYLVGREQRFSKNLQRFFEIELLEESKKRELYELIDFHVKNTETNKKYSLIMDHKELITTFEKILLNLDLIEQQEQLSVYTEIKEKYNKAFTLLDGTGDKTKAKLTIKFTIRQFQEAPPKDDKIGMETLILMDKVFKAL